MYELREAGVLVFFFFQAEDGIRDIGVTGVQTCALPISLADAELFFRDRNDFLGAGTGPGRTAGLVHIAHACGRIAQTGPFARSEERRVGKECRSRWSPYH